jgi:hypothetical protein
MSIERLAAAMDECKARGFDVAAMPASDLYNVDIPRDVRDVLALHLVRRHSERRAAELAAK